MRIGALCFPLFDNPVSQDTDGDKGREEFCETNPPCSCNSLISKDLSLFPRHKTNPPDGELRVGLGWPTGLAISGWRAARPLGRSLALPENIKTR